MNGKYVYSFAFKITSHGIVKLYIGALFASSISAFAAPQSGTVTLGNAAISQSGLSTQITQTTQKAAINWQSFSIANNESVEFKQPNTSAIALNRVIGNEKSIIDGILKANGQVFLINKNGLLFGKDSYVNVGGLVASTLDLQDSDFAKDNFVFKGSGSGKIINLGKIEAKEQGYVVFISSSISNEGVISSKLGKTALLAGDEAKLTVSDGSLVSFEITKGVVDALVENKNAIYADGGEVTLSAKGVDELKKSVVNNTGVIEAKTIGTKEGKIYLLADKGSVKVGGKLDASAPATGNGGFIETSGDKVEISPILSVTTKAKNGKTGTWLIDPTDYYIAASGGDITGALLSSQLESNNIIIKSVNGATNGNGDIFVNDAVTWGANTTLTLDAIRDIQINENISATGNSAGISLLYGGGYFIKQNKKISLTGATPTVGINGVSYTVVNDITAIQNISSNLGGKYVITKDIDASSIGSFNPIGSVSNQFLGVFEGFGNKISNLTINKPSDDYVGLFSFLGNGSKLSNLTLENQNVTGRHYTGAVAGWNEGNAKNITVSAGSVNGADYVGGVFGVNHADVDGLYSYSNVNGGWVVGGIVGFASHTLNNLNSYANVIGGGQAIGGAVGKLYNGAVLNSYSSANVTGDYYIGGLVGFADTGTKIDNSKTETGKVTLSKNYGGGLAGSNFGEITNSSSSMTIEGGYQNIGGLVGYNDAIASIKNSFSNSVINSINGDLIGGLVGVNYGLISDSYATGDVSGVHMVGGLAGFSGGYQSLITDSYATGKVNAVFDSAGGLVGKLYNGIIRNSYATGNVTAESYAGGLIGSISGTDSTIEVSNTYALGDVTTTANYAGGLIGAANNGTQGVIKNSYAKGNVKGAYNVGGLMGYNEKTLSNSYSEGGTVTATGDYAGGLVGVNYGIIEGSTALQNVSGNYNVGGIAGYNGATGTVVGSKAINAVSGYSGVGGLVGLNDGGLVSQSYFVGSVTGISDATGGIAGYNTNGGKISETYTDGSVKGGNHTGGLVGFNLNGGSVSNSYSLASVTGDLAVGGLVGNNDNGSISNSYSTGFVTANGLNGGLVGLNQNGATVTGSFWNTDTSGTTFASGDGAIAGATGLSNSDMKNISNYSGASWSIDDAGGTSNVWRIYDGQTNPMLRAFMTKYELSPTTSKTYDGATFAPTQVLGSGSADQNKLVYSGDAAAVNAGTYNVSAYSYQNGYDLVGQRNTSFSITPKTLTVAGTTVADKTYDGTATATVSIGTVTGLVGTQTLNIAASGVFSDPNVGTNKNVAVNYLLSNGANGGLASNYAVSTQTLMANILSTSNGNGNGNGNGGTNGNGRGNGKGKVK